MNDSAPRDVRILMHPGRLGYVRVITTPGRTVKAIAFPRECLTKLQNHDESSGTGVYVLWGINENNQLPKVYIGKSDDVRKRLNIHSRNGDKNFWSQTFIFISTDQSLNNTHGQHIEAKLIEKAQGAERCILDNQTNPKTPRMTDVERSLSDSFLIDLLSYLSAISIDFFEKRRTETSSSRRLISDIEEKSDDEIEPASPESQEPTATEPPTTDIEILHIKSEKKNVKASGYIQGNNFVVNAGSQAAKTETPSAQAHVINKRKELIKLGVLRFNHENDVYEFTKDYEFESPSGASSTVLGRNCNGLTAWKSGQRNKTLKKIQKPKVSTGGIDDPIDKLGMSTSDIDSRYRIKSKGIKAYGYPTEHGFVVTEGSQATKNEFPSAQQHVINKRKELIKLGVLQQKGDVYEFTRDYQFQTPSSASCVVLGRSSSGWVEWKDENGKPLNETQQP